MGETPSFFVEKTRTRNQLNLLIQKPMSREEFRNFIKTVEHNILVKEKVLKCQTSKDLILLAK